MDLVVGPDILVILFFVAMLAGFVDTIAGGGGLITIPVLLLAQVPPINALATNKLQGSFGTLTSSLTMLRKRIVRFEDIWKPALLAFAGAALGTFIIQLVDVSVLDIVIPVVLVMIGLYFLFTPSAGKVERVPRMSARAFNCTVVPTIAFYDGIFGPGTGSFFSLANVALRGQQIIKATANAKVFNFASNVASVALFVLGGKVLWLIGGIMIVGQIIGAYAGSLMVISHGSKFIRPLIVLVCFVMVTRYLLEKF
ncbi:MAG: TSUP family transporter [Advenella sp.]